MSLPDSNRLKIVQGVKLILQGMGEDPERDGLKDTPLRVAKLYDDILDGQFAKLPRITDFEAEQYGGSIMVHHVPFYGFCEHHMLPFIGHFGMAYVPDQRILGLSKLVRLFRQGVKRLTIQERITQEAVDLMMDKIKPKGAICFVEAEHTCMSLRGVKSPGSLTTTVAWKGIYQTDSELRQMFIHRASQK